MDNRHIPVTTLEELNSLDDKEVIEGYFDGFEDWPCGDNRSRAYWHGWRNGRVDGGHAQPDHAQQLLAFENAMQRWKSTIH